MTAKRFTRKTGIPDNVLFSVQVRSAGEVQHYDIHFEEEGIRFDFLGGYWDGVKPFAGPSKRVDMYIYSLLKKRRRETRETRREDFTIRYDDIVRVEILRREEDARVTIWLKSGRWLEMRIPSKIYDLAYKLLKRHLEKRLKDKGGWVVRRAR